MPNVGGSHASRSVREVGRVCKELVIRKEAVARGLTTYYTGKPCVNGHVSGRYVNGKCCVECSIKRGRNRWHTNQPAAKHCIGCGRVFLSDRRVTVYCSKTCSSNNRPDVRAKRQRQAEATVRHRASFRLACEVCRQPMTAITKTQRLCSEPCRAEDARRRSQVVAARQKEVAGKVVARECQECGGKFMTVYGTSRRTFCSDRCGRRFARRLRRRRLRAGVAGRYSPLMIFERDRWRCQLCGGKVDRGVSVPHPESPVIDHILPLARGGRDEVRNVHCAHFRCNSLKRDGAVGEQMRLF